MIFRMSKRHSKVLTCMEEARSNANYDRRSTNSICTKVGKGPHLAHEAMEQRVTSHVNVLCIRICIVVLFLFLVLHGRGQIDEISKPRTRSGGNVSVTDIPAGLNFGAHSTSTNTEVVPSPMMSPRSKNLKLAMLISFPNSGTSFTLSTVRRASRQHVAGTACLSNDEQFSPVYRSRTKRGPHFIPVANDYHNQLERPQKYILTKTHCTGYDNSPMPSPTKYLVPQERFTKACHKVCSPEVLIDVNKKETNHEEETWKLYYFNETLVGSFVHLFRDPFDNIVSRWHCHMSGAEVKNPHEVNKWEVSVDGFQKFCHERDEYHRFNEAPLLSRELVEASEGVPCRTDFLRYVQWHNRAFQMTQSLAKPVHILHYVDFQDNYNGTLEKLLNFLELPHTAQGDNFRWSDYTAYFTDEQRMATKRFIKFYASNETLHELTRYGI